MIAKALDQLLSGETPADARLDVLQMQGYAPFAVEMKITDDAGKELPWDGKKFGRLKVKGVAVTKGYFKGEGGDPLLTVHHPQRVRQLRCVDAER